MKKGPGKRGEAADPQGLEAAARVIAAGGRVPRKFAKARPASAGPTREAGLALEKIAPARRAAFEILSLVEKGKAHSDEALHGPRMAGLSEADRKLATALVMGVLRWQIGLDAQIRRLLARPEQRLAEPVMLALRLGAFQLLHMDRIPAHAALNESVQLCRAAGEPHAAGMVNAVLRKVSQPRSQNRDLGHPGSVPIFETTARVAERLGHPAWLVERWVRQYGREAAVAICEADQQEAVAVEDADQGAPDGMPEMDRGSRLVAEIAAAAAPKVDGRALKVWDCCAAPGGKTLVLSRMLDGAQVLATDVSARRLELMQRRIKAFRYGGKIKGMVADAAALPEEAGEFDLILCDVPCSGTGTLGRNPEIRLRLSEGDLARQAARQRKLLQAGLSRLAAGGRLVYSTCSLEREENEDVVAAAAAGWQRVAVNELGVAGVEETMVREGALRTLPGVHPGDGFFAVVLERDASAAGAA